MTRRAVVIGAAASLGLPSIGRAAGRLRLGITPVFLDNDARILTDLRAAFAEALGRNIELTQRRTYEEVTGLLLEGSLDAAWLCGYPYLQHKKHLALLAVPVWRGRPLYQSYLIVQKGDKARGLSDLRGYTHAFSDPNSNSGFLVTASDLAGMGVRPENFFRRTIFTYGHRNVVRAVAAGLVQSGSVDGYVWEFLAVVEPDLAAQTQVIHKSEWLGFPPFCAQIGRANDPDVLAMQSVLTTMSDTTAGRKALRSLLLDGMVKGSPALFDGIARRMQIFAALR